MRRTDPHTVTYLLVFLVVYVLITGILVLVLRAMILDEREAQLEALESRSLTLEESVAVRAVQEGEIVRELIAVSGARDFEDAYVRIRTEIDELRLERDRVEELVAIERDLRVAAVQERDAVGARAQALALERDRLEANLALCLDRLVMCSATACR